MKTFSGETNYSRKISAEQTKQDTAETGEAATWLQYGTVSDLLVSSRLLEVNHDQIVRRYEGIPGKGGSRGESSNRRRRIEQAAWTIYQQRPVATESAEQFKKVRNLTQLNRAY